MTQQRWGCEVCLSLLHPPFLTSLNPSEGGTWIYTPLLWRGRERSSLTVLTSLNPSEGGTNYQFQFQTLYNSSPLERLGEVISYFYMAFALRVPKHRDQRPKHNVPQRTIKKINKSASVYSVFDEDKIVLNKFRSSEPVRKSLNL